MDKKSIANAIQAEYKEYRANIKTMKEKIMPQISACFLVSLDEKVKQDLESHADYKAWERPSRFGACAVKVEKLHATKPQKRSEAAVEDSNKDSVEEADQSSAIDLSEQLSDEEQEEDDESEPPIPKGDPHKLLEMLKDVTLRKRFLKNTVFQDSDELDTAMSMLTFSMNAGESLAGYKKRFEQFMDQAAECGLPVPKAGIQVHVFGRGLKAGREKDHLDKLYQNSGTNPEAWPKSIQALYDILEPISRLKNYGATASYNRQAASAGKPHNRGQPKRDNKPASQQDRIPKDQYVHNYDPGAGASMNALWVYHVRMPGYSHVRGPPQPDYVESDDDRSEPDETSLPDLIEEDSSDDESSGASSDGELESLSDSATFSDEAYRLPLPPSLLRQRQLMEEPVVINLCDSSDEDGEDGGPTAELVPMDEELSEDDLSRTSDRSYSPVPPSYSPTIPVLEYDADDPVPEQIPYQQSLKRLYASESDDDFTPSHRHQSCADSIELHESRMAKRRRQQETSCVHPIQTVLAVTQVDPPEPPGPQLSLGSDGKSRRNPVQVMGIFPQHIAIPSNFFDLVSKNATREEVRHMVAYDYLDMDVYFEHCRCTQEAQIEAEHIKRDVCETEDQWCLWRLVNYYQLTERKARRKQQIRNAANSDPPPDNPSIAVENSNSRTQSAEVVNAFNVNALNNASCYVNTFSSIDSNKKIREVSTVLLDSAAGCSLFKNPALLTDVRTNKTPIGVRGVNRDAPLVATKAGYYSAFGLVAVCPQISENILSMGEMRDRGHKISYYTKSDVFVMTSKDEKRTIRFTRHGRHYKHVVPHTVDAYASATYAQTDTNIPGSIEQRAAIYPKKAVQRAVAARRIQARLGYPSSTDFASMNIQGADITTRDVAIADHIFGPPTATLKGRTTKRASPPIIPTAPVVIEANQTLEIDVMFVNRLPFLVAILVPLGYSLVDYTPNRKEKEIHQSLFKFITKIMARKITITHVVSDNEGSAHTAESKLNSMGIQLSTTAAGEKVHRVERRIRFIKERVRSIVHSLPYRLCAKLLTYCVYYANWCTNNHRMAMSTHTRTPHEQFTGRNLHAARDLRHAFGDYVQATLPHTNNSMQARTEACIALIHSGSLTGGVVMYCVKTDSTVVRDQFRILPAPPSLIKHLNNLARLDGMPELDVDIDDTPDTTPLPPPPSLTGLDPSTLTIPVDTEWRGDRKKATRAATKSREEAKQIANDLESEAKQQTKRVTLHPPESSSDEEDNNTHEHQDNGTDDMYWKDIDTFTTDVIKECDTLVADVLNISVKTAIKTHGDTAVESITKEIRQLWEKNAWTPVMKKEIPQEDRSRIIRSFMFLKEKFTAEGLMDKLKSRLVANGKQQDRQLYDTLASPTAALMSLLIVAAIAAHENRETATVDIGGAFLHAKPNAANPIYVVLDKVMSDTMIKIDKNYERYRDKKGEITVRLDRALYGCVESALLWYNHISNTLAAIGFEKNKYDQCVYNMLKEGVQCTVVLHVDDLFVTCREKKVIDMVLAELKEKYGETNESRGDKHNYLGMVFDFTKPGMCKISMPGFEQTLFDNESAYKRAATPATDNLFEVCEESEKQDAKEMRDFHTKVAKLLYLAKRTRPECLVAVSYLTTRVTKCTVEDRAKLNRVLGYIQSTKGAAIMLKPGVKGITLEQYVDAAYGVHVDGKSHTGSVITLGDIGAVFCGSKKQGIVTKSSTECELVALSDSIGQLIHARRFLEEQGHEQKQPTTVYQDNMSTIALVKAGRPGNERSRHISIRYFWVTEKVEEKELQVVHMPTAMMIANLLTKPLQGSQFRSEARMLSNSPHLEQMDIRDEHEDHTKTEQDPRQDPTPGISAGEH